jgi:nitrogen regulatory protein P-II 1
LKGEATTLKEDMSLICAVVGHQQSDKVAKAAVNAGAHGPIVYYSEGRGIRDRLGWLRITKETEKEVLMVLADEADVEQVFNAMAKAAELHLPGRGFMYRLPITQGLFNLPGRVSNQRYTANMQQMINAIDHLAGHTDWRDQTVFAVGGSGKGVGLNVAIANSSNDQPHVCLSAIAKRDDTQRLMDMMLDAGAPGLNLNFANFSAAQEGDLVAGARINQDYGILRCVVTRELAPSICNAISQQAEPAGITDLCLMQIAAPRVATYVPGRIDFRETESAA